MMTESISLYLHGVGMTKMIWEWYLCCGMNRLVIDRCHNTQRTKFNVDNVLNFFANGTSPLLQKVKFIIILNSRFLKKSVTGTSTQCIYSISS